MTIFVLLVMEICLLRFFVLSCFIYVPRHRVLRSHYVPSFRGGSAIGENRTYRTDVGQPAWI